MVDPQENKSSWLLRGSILAAVQHVLDELNLEDHGHARQQWKDEQRTKPLSQLPPIVQAAPPHPDRPSLRGLPPGTTWRNAFAKQAEEQDHPDDPHRYSHRTERRWCRRRVAISSTRATTWVAATAAISIGSDRSYSAPAMTPPPMAAAP